MINRSTLWFKRLERQLQRLASSWGPAAIAAIIVSGLAICRLTSTRAKHLLRAC